jgi:hypothetical protein
VKLGFHHVWYSDSAYFQQRINGRFMTTNFCLRQPSFQSCNTVIFEFNRHFPLQCRLFFLKGRDKRSVLPVFWSDSQPVSVSISLGKKTATNYNKKKKKSIKSWLGGISSSLYTL